MVQFVCSWYMSLMDSNQDDLISREVILEKFKVCLSPIWLDFSEIWSNVWSDTMLDYYEECGYYGHQS